MPAPAEILEAIAPEIDTGDPSVLVHINLAEQQTGKVYRDSRNHAVALLAAHTLTLGQRGGSGGQVTSESEGQLSRSYGSVAGQSRLDATSYGQELERLRRQYVFAARTVHV